MIKARRLAQKKKKSDGKLPKKERIFTASSLALGNYTNILKKTKSASSENSEISTEMLCE